MKKLDLHGFTLEDAFDEFTDFIYEAYNDNLSNVEIVTGKSGQIRKEFPFWSENNHQIRSIEASWHGGSFVVKLQKKYLFFNFLSSLLTI